MATARGMARPMLNSARTALRSRQRRFLPYGLAAGAVVAALALADHRMVHNDALPPRPGGGDEVMEAVLVKPDPNDGLLAWSWGSNRYHVASSSKKTLIRTPQPLPHLSGVALRDLALHEQHGACVDAVGDVYQWGDGFFGSSSSEQDKSPKVTLKGKDISDLAVTSSKVYALSKSSGKIYVLSSSSARQQPVEREAPSWWTFQWLWGQSPSIDFVELKPDSKLGTREKFTYISAGRHHLLALTSSGRTFSHAVSSLANTHGQLGMSKVTVHGHESSGGEISVDLVPKALQDSFATATPYIRPSIDVPSSTDDADIRWCEELYEVPSLKGVKAAQIITGGRSSYLRTEDEGRVLAWGANEYGQLGLGATFALSTVPVPTEVVLTRAYPGGTALKCTDVAAGGDIVYFTVERKKPVDENSAVDVLAAGMGQWGALGHGLYSQVQGAPVRVKTVSGILEYDDATSSLKALAPHAISVSPTGHVLLTLDTLSLDGPGGAQGRDVLTWGLNSSYELGTGKRSSAAVPNHVKSLGGAPQRLMMRQQKKEVKDLQGRTWGRNVLVQECAVAGWGCSAVYWKIL